MMQKFLKKYYLLLLIFHIFLELVNSQKIYRLPQNIIPSKYEIDLFVSEGVFRGHENKFEGDVTITFTVTNNTSEINLHTESNITNIFLSSEISLIPLTNTSYNETTKILKIFSASELIIETVYSLSISYIGTFAKETMVGFFISTYKEENSDEISYMVLTKFEPIHSRHAFPCLDEPEYKANFQLSLTYPSGFNAQSNTFESSNSTLRINGSDYTKTTFAQTTIMSTYLLAFSISKFTCTEGLSIAENIPHRVCSRPQEESHRKWALEIGTSLLRNLESLFGIKYGTYMPKMDQLAIPDFAAGAMENWGLISYRETNLLYDEKESSLNYKKSVARVIAHEFSHSWFGNLVTCKWWDYLFLNEGFATYFEYFAGSATKQLLSWELDKLFIVEVVHPALLSDSFNNANSLTSTALNPSEIFSKFGTISYDKGAALLRMIEKNLMGEENFISGIREYLKTYSQKATIPSQLWSSYANHIPSEILPSGISFNEAVYNWVEIPGHPVVTVSKDKNNVILNQQRFLLSGGNNSNNSTNEYYVPITYTLSNDSSKFSNTTVKSWLIPGNNNLTLSGLLAENNWIILNNRQAGFYRVDYDNSLWSAINDQLVLNHLKIDVLNRAQIISDGYNFARSGHNSDGYGTRKFSEFFELLKYLEHETDYYPWYATIVGNNQLMQRIGYDSEIGQLFTRWMVNLMENVYNTVSFDIIDNNDLIFSLKQVLILARICRYGESTCIAKSKMLFSDYRDKGIKVPKNLKSVVYCNALRYSEDPQRDFNFLWKVYKNTSLMTEVVTIYSALSCIEDIALLKWYLGQTINPLESGIRLQDFSSVWSYIYSSSKIGTNAAIQFISENYTELKAFMDTANPRYSSIALLISGAAGYIYDEEQIVALEALLNLTVITSSDLSAGENAISAVRANIKFSNDVSDNIKEFLTTQQEENKNLPSMSTTNLPGKFSMLLFLLFLLIINNNIF